MGKSSGMERKTKVYFVNPPFKAEYGKFSRENRSPAVTRSGTLYYPLWLIYAAAICEKDGFPIEFLDAPAGQMDKKTALERIAENGAETKLFVVSTSTPSIYSDVAFGESLKEQYPESRILLVGTHPSALPEETLGISEKIDFVARKEFDYIVRDIARALEEERDPCRVEGITYRKAGRSDRIRICPISQTWMRSLMRRSLFTGI